MIARRVLQPAGMLSMADSMSQQRIILASGSQARRAMLRAAGLVFEIMPADVNEAAIRDALPSENPECEPADVAEVLACAKAENVSRAHPGAVVIGSDQILSFGRKIFTKSLSLDSARAVLLELRGKTHQLQSCAAIAQGGDVSWTHVETTDLKMRDFSDAFLDRYLESAGNDVLGCVGAFQIEGLGIQLFERIEGDYFTILGLPLLPLLAELRARKVLQT